MKDYIQIGIDKGLISFNEDKSRIKYNWQNKERNYNNPEEKVQARTFLENAKKEVEQMIMGKQL